MDPEVETKFLCLYSKSELDRRVASYGFAHHVQKTKNKWSYNTYPSHQS